MHLGCTRCGCAYCQDNAEEENHHCSGCWEGRFLTLFAGGAFAFDDMLLLLMSLLSLLLCWSCWSSSSSSSSPLSSTSPQIRFLESKETRQQETNHLVDVEKIVIDTSVAYLRMPLFAAPRSLRFPSPTQQRRP